MSEDSTQVRLTVDELGIDRDGCVLATLIDDEGRAVTIPAGLLPEDAKVNDVIEADFRLDPGSTAERKARVRRLQHRLFDRGSVRE